MRATPISATGRPRWTTLAALKPAKLVPGRGPALQTEAQVAAGLAGTRSFISDVYASVQAGAAAGKDLNAVYRETMAALRPKYGHWVIFDHCMPFDVSRAYRRSHRAPRPAHLDRRARRRPCGRRSNPEGGAGRCSNTYTWPRYAYRRAPELGHARRAPRAAGRGGRRPGGAECGHRRRAAWPAGGAARRRRHRQRRLARRLLCQAHAGDLRPPGRRPARSSTRA